MRRAIEIFFGWAGWIGSGAVVLLSGCVDGEVSAAEQRARDLLAGVMSYHAELGEYPAGSDLEISHQLHGKNSMKKGFVLLGADYFSEESGFLDPWGKPYRFAVLPEKKLFYIYSLGPDGVSDGVDDIGEVALLKNP